MAALGGSVSRRYARALFSLGVDRGTFEQLARELDALSELLEGSAELRDTLANPVFKSSEKRRLLEALLARMQPSPELRAFTLLLFERGRLPFLARIARDFRDLADARLGQVRGRVVSATALSADELARVQGALERRLGKKVLLETHQDPELLGGVVAQVGDLVLDGSLRARLRALSDRLLN